MRNDLSLTRINMAEHAYPTPTRNILSEQNRGKRKMSGKASEIRFGIRTPDGTTVMGYTESELAKIRSDELANKLIEMAERKARMQSGATSNVADHWSHKV